MVLPIAQIIKKRRESIVPLIARSWRKTQILRKCDVIVVKSLNIMLEIATSTNNPIVMTRKKHNLLMQE